MSRTVATALQNHLAGNTTTALCMAITRRDGTAYRVNDGTSDLTVDGNTYASEATGVPSAYENTSNFETATLTVGGVFDVAGISRADMVAGKFDYASMDIFLVDYTDTTNKLEQVPTMKFGRVNWDDAGFSVDLLGPSHYYEQTVGHSVTPYCQAKLFDAKCGLTQSDYKETGTVTAVTNNHVFECTITNTNSNAITTDDWFGEGEVEWTGSTDNVGMLPFQIREHTYDGGSSRHTITLHENTPFTIAVNDTFDIIPGCRKRYDSDCKTKFNNLVNFWKGFPFVPTRDEAAKRPSVKL